MMRFIFILLVLVFSVKNSNSQGIVSNKIEGKLLEKFVQSGEQEYLIFFDHQADLSSSKFIKGKVNKSNFAYEKLTNQASKAQVHLISFLKEKNITYHSFYILNCIKVKTNLEIAKVIASFPEVAKLYPDSPIPLANDRMKNSIARARNPEPEWGIKKIQADSVWRLGYQGQGVVVGGEDTGYDWEVSPLKSKYRGWNGFAADHSYNWHDAIHDVSPLNSDSLNPCGFNLKYPCDDHNHGTHTMGTMVGSDDENSIGVAPMATWIGCRNMERGWGKPSTYLECFEWFLAPTDSLGENPNPALAPHVINNSWGCPPEEGCDTSNFKILNTAVLNLKAAGTVVVVSAGNSGPSCGSVDDPAAIFEASFSVGATKSNDTIAGFSSRGPVVIDSSFRLKPNVAAPGQDVRSVIRGGVFANFSGTSMAGPHVVGLVALIISANPELAGEVDLIEDIIEATAVPKTTEQDCGAFLGMDVPNAVYGYGRVDALKAVEMALLATSSKNNFKEDEISIFPNPVSDQMTIKYNEGKIGSWTIFGMDGRRIMTGSLDSYGLLEVDLSNYSDGLYYFTIQTKESITTKKIVLQKK